MCESQEWGSYFLTTRTLGKKAKCKAKFGSVQLKLLRAGRVTCRC